MTVHLFKPPLHSTGIYSERLSDSLSALGVDSRCETVGSDRTAVFFDRWCPAAIAPRLIHLSARLASGKFASKTLRPNDVALVYTNWLFSDAGLRCPFENAVKRSGAKYVFHLPDAWPVSPLWKPHVDARIRIADCVATVTPALTELVRRMYPGIRCETLEEAVATEDFDPAFGDEDGKPVVVWSGPPSKIGEVLGLLPVLESVYRKIPFSLRIVSGRKPPRLSASFPVDWLPFWGLSSAEQFRNASIAFAKYKTDEYSHCKGNYKVKKYLAAGCAVVTSPVGYNLDMIRPGVDGLFATTPEEWEEAFLHLLRNPGERLAMRKAARETAVRRFSYAAIAKQYAGVLRNLGWV